MPYWDIVIVAGMEKGQQPPGRRGFAGERDIGGEDMGEGTVSGRKGSGVNHTILILVVSFGTVNKQSCRLAIGAIEEEIGKAFPDCEVRRAFTSRFVIDRLKGLDGAETDHVTEGLERAVKEGIANLAVQPTFLTKGQEYTKLAGLLKQYEGRFRRIVFGEPLLSGNADLDMVAKAVGEKLSLYDDGRTAICLMGHGTEGESNRVYTRLQEKMRETGYGDFYIGTMESEPSLADILLHLKEKGIYERVVLSPLMMAAGKHVYEEMAGDKDGSWKRIMQGRGYEVECLTEGLGQMPAVRKVYVGHVRAALEQLCL